MTQSVIAELVVLVVCDETSTFIAVLCDVVRHHYHNFHPNLGIHLMKLGKIQLYIEQLAAAEKSLQQVSGNKVAFYQPL